MRRRPEPMLARWPLLHPEITGASEQDDDRVDETNRIRELVVTPILESRDIAAAFVESREAYKVWKEFRTSEATDLEVVLDREDRLGDSLADIMEDHRDELGERTVRAIQEVIQLRKIVRSSILPHQETWPAESWDRISHLMASSELSLVAILEYLATGVGCGATWRPWPPGDFSTPRTHTSTPARTAGTR